MEKLYNFDAGITIFADVDKNQLINEYQDEFFRKMSALLDNK